MSEGVLHGDDAFNLGFLTKHCAWCTKAKKKQRSTTSNVGIVERSRSWTYLLVSKTVILLQWRRCGAPHLVGVFPEICCEPSCTKQRGNRTRQLSHCAGSGYHSFLGYKRSCQFQSQLSTASILFTTERLLRSVCAVTVDHKAFVSELFTNFSIAEAFFDPRSDINAISLNPVRRGSCWMFV